MKTPSISPDIQQIIERNVQAAISEDLGAGDLTVKLLDSDSLAKAQVITRESCVLCGVAWANAVFSSIDSELSVKWLKQDGDSLAPNDVIVEIQGSARSLLTAERCALNFIQTLSATATLTRQYAKAVEHTACKILDTRKTIPGLRDAQKYAVLMGGGQNHRVGLYDGVLIKENHIAAHGSITKVLEEAFTVTPAGVMIEIEVETLEQLNQALKAGAKRILLDNFSPELIKQAVQINIETFNSQAKLEASGNITIKNVADYADAGVDFISLGAITKNIQAIDLSLRIITE